MSTRRGGIGLAILVGTLFLSAILTLLVTVLIWPGEAKLTAPVFCPDDKPDAFVVSDTVSVQPGETSTNYTLYCLDERGAAENVGWLGPTLVLFAVHTAALFVPVIGLSVTRRRRRATLP